MLLSNVYILVDGITRKSNYLIENTEVEILDNTLSFKIYPKCLDWLNTLGTDVVRLCIYNSHSDRFASYDVESISVTARLTVQSIIELKFNTCKYVHFNILDSVCFN
jgi:hypothetical protein